MKRFSNLKIGTRLLLQTILILFLVLAISFPYLIITLRNSDVATSEQNALNIAEKNAGIISETLSAPLAAARGLVGIFQQSALVSVYHRRATYNAFMQEVLQQNDQVFGVWAIFEPNQFDGLDLSFIGRRDDTDATGRYVPYIYRDGDDFTLGVVEGYDQPGSGDFYLLARDSGRESILNPYYYEIEGQNVLLTTISVPVRNLVGSVIGVVGFDIKLDTLQQTTFDRGVYDNSYFFVAANDGSLIIHPDQDLIMKNQAEISTPEEAALTIPAISSGQQLVVSGFSALDQSRVRKVFSPVYIGSIPTPWSTCLVVSEADIMASSNLITLTLIMLMMILLLAVSIPLNLVIRKSIAIPLKNAVYMISEMSRGHLGHRLNIASRDEIGQMALAMDNFSDFLQKSVIGNMNRIAVGDIQMELNAIDEKDEITPAMIRTVRAIRQLVDDAGNLAEDAVSGHLDSRADASRHQGDYARIVAGVNRTLDAVISPVQEASAVLADMASGNLKGRVLGDYQGDHAAIKIALNTTLDALEGYVGEISHVLTEMAGSNLIITISGDYKGDFAPIKQALNIIIDTFNQVLRDLGQAAEQVAASSRQVSDGSQSLSQGATEQASSVEELTASLGEIAAQTRQNAMSANQASDLATGAQTRAVEGNQKMALLQSAMQEISRSSSDISRIIKAIDDIAFQTNILALNAAVEAARAGQHGKGFAVVAEEVRNLAARSAKAATETTGLIETSLSHVASGSQLAAGTAIALDQIVSTVTEAADLVSSIAVASNGQASAIAQINSGVEQISAVVQANSATAEESAAASEELTGQAVILREMIGKFTIRR